ncbi:MAG: GNAT family N-acetyltransferase [Bacteroidales bacterium]
MIHVYRITDRDDERLKTLVGLYEEAFPAEERRSREQLYYLIEGNDKMFFNAVEIEGELAGLFVYWNMNDFYYLEHLAVFASMRNKEIGRQILDYASLQLNGLRLLEVEPDDTEMAARRINYYKRNGYAILNRNYIQPSYAAHEDACPLWIMGNQENAEIEKYIEQIKETVYRSNVGKPE